MMAGYIAMRVMDREETEGIESAQVFYTAVFSITLYQQFQEEVDSILTLEGKKYLIPTA